MAERTVVVGGGIAGLLAARLAARQGAHVTLIDAAPHFGGLLRSVEHDGHHFDFGTHIPALTGDPDIDHLLFDVPVAGGWLELDHLDVGCLFNGVLVDRGLPDLRVLPRADYARALLGLLEAHRSSATAESAAQELQAVFGPVIAHELYGPILDKIYGRPLDQLAPGAHLPFYPRVLALSREVVVALKSIPALDSALAYVDVADAPPMSHRYPANGGCGSWVHALLEAMRDDGVDLRPSTNVARIDPSSRRLELASGEHIVCDRLVWSVAPALALRAAGAPIPGNGPPDFVRVDLFHTVSSRPHPHDWQYVMDAEPGHRTFRVTAYENIRTPGRGPATLTAEVLTPPGRERPTEHLVMQELVESGIAADGCCVVGSDTIDAGFPVWSTQLRETVVAQVAAAQDALPWATFVGRTSSPGFLMSSVLVAVRDALVGPQR